jgi:hypothetical protein
LQTVANVARGKVRARAREKDRQRKALTGEKVLTKRVKSGTELGKKKRKRLIVSKKEE